MQSDTAVVIGQLATPVVMISAAGLISLGLFNRYAVLVARSRTFANERLLLLRTATQAAPGANGNSIDRIRMEALEAHSSGVLKRASLVRAALQCLLTSILAMLASSAAIGLSLVSQPLWFVAFLAFALGLLAMAAGVGLEMAELALSLRDVRLEDRLLHELEEFTG